MSHKAGGGGRPATVKRTRLSPARSPRVGGGWRLRAWPGRPSRRTRTASTAHWSTEGLPGQRSALPVRVGAVAGAVRVHPPPLHHPPQQLCHACRLLAQRVVGACTGGRGRPGRVRGDGGGRPSSTEATPTQPTWRRCRCQRGALPNGAQLERAALDGAQQRLPGAPCRWQRRRRHIRSTRGAAGTSAAIRRCLAQPAGRRLQLLRPYCAQRAAAHCASRWAGGSSRRCWQWARSAAVCSSRWLLAGGWRGRGRRRSCCPAGSLWCQRRRGGRGRRSSNLLLLGASCPRCS